ncbi:MAG: RNA polymerase sigma factor [Longimicrobiales bacterium]
MLAPPGQARGPRPDSLDSDLHAIDGALAALRAFDPELGQVVEYHLYGGLSLDAIANVLGLPLRMVRARWVRARTLLLDVLEGRARGSARPPDPVSYP